MDAEKKNKERKFSTGGRNNQQMRPTSSTGATSADGLTINNNNSPASTIEKNFLKKLVL